MSPVRVLVRYADQDELRIMKCMLNKKTLLFSMIATILLTSCNPSVINENDDELVNYGLNQNRFKIYKKDGWLTYNKSYLQLPKNVSDAIERNIDVEGYANLTFVFNNADGTTDKVSCVEFQRNSESDIFYNPYGLRVNANTKGIVISNGKKTITVTYQGQTATFTITVGKVGCGGSIMATSILTLALAGLGLAFVSLKKKKED